jgi:hypothetical protein
MGWIPSDEDLRGLLKKSFQFPEMYDLFCAWVKRLLVAMLCYYDDDAARIDESCRDALEALKLELRRGWDGKRNYLLQLIALAHEALARRKRAAACEEAVTQFGVSLTALFAVLYTMADAGARKCSWVWRAHLLIAEGDPVALESCREAVQRWLKGS